LSSILYKYLKEREPLVKVPDTIPYPYVGVRKVFRIGHPLNTCTEWHIKKEFDYQAAKALLELKRDGILLVDKISSREIESYAITTPKITPLGDRKYMVEACMGAILKTNKQEDGYL